MPKRVIDIKLINDIINVNPHLFQVITEEWFDIIYYYILHIVKDKDTTQTLTNDVFVKVYNNLNLYKAEYKFGTWIYKIATNITIDYLRKQKLRLEQTVEFFEDELHKIEDESTPEKEMQKSQNAATLNTAVSKLKEPYRNIIKMRFYEDLTYEEIAKKMNMPIGTIKAYLHRAKKILSQMITNQEK